MTGATPRKAGRHFLQIPGPSNVPDAVLRAMARPTIDHRGPEFAAMTRRILDRLRTVLRTSRPVLLFPSSGTGAWEAALVNTLAPGDRVLAFETGQFAALWRDGVPDCGGKLWPERQLVRALSGETWLAAGSGTALLVAAGAAVQAAAEQQPRAATIARLHCAGLPGAAGLAARYVRGAVS